MPKFWFYTVDPGGQIHRGNGRRVVREGDAGESVDALRLEDRFRTFEARIKANTKSEKLDSETKAGLEALGYAQ